MLTVYTSTFCRPDLVQLLADSLRATLREDYRFVVVVHPGGLRREWRGVDEVRSGSAAGYGAILEAVGMVDGPSVILHDDCVPVLPWDAESFGSSFCSRRIGHTLQYREGPRAYGPCMIDVARISDPADCPAGWPERLRDAAAAGFVESLLGGVFLHLDKGTIAAPDCPANAAKPLVIEAIAEHLGIDAPEPLTPAERAIHPGGRYPAPIRVKADRRPNPGLGDLVAAGLTAIGITKERAQAVASAVGIKDCGCAKRQAALNRLGERLGFGGGEGTP